ncbi:hypothetical protein Lesp02_84010 [Lentzea sp. NBRC 105346]|uniref:hypothetical protein n=1 Tax=Lentzea sp. NBRC 105346 TaxID=3032205 RepID=UPI0024A268DD|nr:hypothetical protein [Lentzea sp. NBRC 105346]GLZ36214.1 hypothetical protein Lesp02_84010 [Lentzea sp. NBRC 105346]
MGSFVLTNVRMFAGGLDMTGRSNQVKTETEVAEKDSTNFGSGGWGEVKGALVKSEWEAGGQWEAGGAGFVDDELFAALGGVGAWSMCPDGAAVGSLAWLTKAMTAKYQLGDAVGEIAPWSAEAKGSWPLARGLVAHPPGTARTATGNGTGQQLGAVAAGQYLYAAAHILSVAGTSTPTITLGIESAPDNTFAAPTSRISFAAATAVSGQILRTAGAITDTWFRPVWTISGTSPSFLFVVSFGVK